MQHVENLALTSNMSCSGISTSTTLAMMQTRDVTHVDELLTARGDPPLERGAASISGCHLSLSQLLRPIVPPVWRMM
jgi:hypothetical protein